MTGWQIAVAVAAAWIGASAFVAFGLMGFVVADLFGYGQKDRQRREFGISNFLIAAGASFLIAAAVLQVFG
jgi:hypothetical protein